MTYKQIRRRMKQDMAENDGATHEVHQAPDVSQIQTDRDLMTADDAFALQDVIGNRATGQIMGAASTPPPSPRTGYVQPKPIPRQPMRLGGSPHEPAYAHLRRKPTLQRASWDGSFDTNADFESQVNQQSGGGKPLPSDVRADLEPKFGADFSGVKVHADAKAAQLSQDVGAQAFTHGSDIYFNQGKYNPESSSGKHLLAHELTHTVQQGGSGVQRQTMIKPRRHVPTIQAKLMSVKEFKRVTKLKWGKRDKIAKVDYALKKIEESGVDSLLLSQLLNAIDGWLAARGDENGRSAGVQQLRQQVIEEQTAISERMSQTLTPPEGGRERRNGISIPILGASKKYGSNFSDFDAKQYRVSGRAPDRRVEEVKRTTTDDGQVVYYATGLLTGFNGNAPLVAPYPEPISLGNWYPSVTHINGMAVAPKGGILSAMAMHESVNSAIGGRDDVALGQGAVDVLYTYSAKRGGVVADLWDCIKGKVQVEDESTQHQENIMLDAVHSKKRVTVSAHSRGTIKTDNAVRLVHQILVQEYTPIAAQDPQVAQIYQEFLNFYEENDMGLGIPPELLAEAARREKIKRLATQRAADDMNIYIQLIYAGNAVQHPSSILKTDFFVGGMDPVSFAVGTYSNTGAKLDSFIGTGGHQDSKVHSVGKTKGHGFVGNYIPAVSQTIAQDLMGREDVQQNILGLDNDQLNALNSTGNQARGRRRR